MSMAEYRVVGPDSLTAVVGAVVVIVVVVRVGVGEGVGVGVALVQ